MRILISGASGLIGHALLTQLRRDPAQHEVLRLVRSEPAPPDAILWQPAEGQLDSDDLEGFDAVVHLAGENIADGRWTDAKIERIRGSRIGGTRLLADRLLQCQRRPKIFIQASAIGYYGDRGSEIMTEDSAPGSGLLPDICQDWEAASEPLEAAGTRVVRLRIGVVMSTEGGALKKMLTPFRFGVGGVVGSGDQYVSWITRDDLVRVLEFALTNDDVQGTLNAVAPNPVTNREMTKALGAALNRPTFLPLPAFAVKTLFGQMGEELLLSSTRVQPTRLQAAGFEFQWPELKSAFRDMLSG